ncbi:PGPGW domain-containing protein [Yonghaparkia sp. Soil809]|uniref:PGPGW domain-containing protein n=1 Tax=Yonghaparkia sp. Soil809 TaxID=1736417 RepID=UPI0009E8B3D6|nr:PGPGW domain-containing protein [Yonghaparkia sp. Soil809]
MTEPEPRILRPGDAAYTAADDARRQGPVRSAAGAAREAIRRNPRLDSAYRTGVKVVGGTTVGLGVVLMPLPGPGALIALGGLAILGTESPRAKKLNQHGVAIAKRAAAAARARREARRAQDPLRDAGRTETPPRA